MALYKLVFNYNLTLFIKLFALGFVRLRPTGERWFIDGPQIKIRSRDLGL